MKLINIWNHFKTVMRHKKLVMQGCFKLGLYQQGICHDLSKFSPTEFLVGCKYYHGSLSPNNPERQEKGYSSAWLHHKGRNKHHLEYWLDYGIKKEQGIVGAKMPVKYVVEMFVDRISASKVYLRDGYTNASPWNYYERGKEYHILHDRTRALLEKLLYMLKEKGEEATFAYIRRHVLIKKNRTIRKWKKRGRIC